MRWKNWPLDFADDTTVISDISDNMQPLQRMKNDLNSNVSKVGLCISCQNTKVMSVGDLPSPQIHIGRRSGMQFLSEMMKTRRLRLAGHMLQRQREDTQTCNGSHELNNGRRKKDKRKTTTDDVQHLQKIYKAGEWLAWRGAKKVDRDGRISSPDVLTGTRGPKTIGKFVILLLRSLATVNVLARVKYF